MTPMVPTDVRRTGASLPMRWKDKEENDPRLTVWLSAGPLADAKGMLIRLVEDVAMPVVTRVVRGKFGTASSSADAEDIISETRLQLLRYLQRLRDDSLDGITPPFIDLPAYVATITYSVWTDHLRRRYPARAMLHNRLRYLLENRASPQGFALWYGPHGERFAGFSAWRETNVTDSTPRQRWLCTDARAAAADAFGGPAHVPTDLAALIAGLFNWLGSPLEWCVLTRILTELLGLAEPAGAPSDWVEDDGGSALDPGFSPHETLRWKEYLGWLWQQVIGLPLNQRTAFLCHSSLLREMELCGLTSIRAAAAALEIPPERMAEIWSRLPLNDMDIAALLGSPNRQQVANLRKAARAHLGPAWQAALAK